MSIIVAFTKAVGFFILNSHFIVWAFSRGTDTVRPGNFSQVKCQDPVVSFWDFGRGGGWGGIRETEVYVRSESWRGTSREGTDSTEGCWLTKPVGECSMLRSSQFKCWWIGSRILYVTIFYIISIFVAKNNRLFSLYVEDTRGLTSEGWCLCFPVVAEISTPLHVDLFRTRHCDTRQSCPTYRGWHVCHWASTLALKLACPTL